MLWPLCGYRGKDPVLCECHHLRGDTHSNAAKAVEFGNFVSCPLGTKHGLDSGSVNCGGELEAQWETGLPSLLPLMSGVCIPSQRSNAKSGAATGDHVWRVGIKV